MNNRLKINLIKFLGTTVFAGAMTAFYVFYRDILNLPLVEQYRTLCDGFFLPGIFLIFFGLMFLMNNVGALDSISYLLRYAVRVFVPGAFADMETYLEYVEARREKRIKGFGFLFAVGALFLLISVAFLLLFYTVYE